MTRCGSRRRSDGGVTPEGASEDATASRPSASPAPPPAERRCALPARMDSPRLASTFVAGVGSPGLLLPRRRRRHSQPSSRDPVRAGTSRTSSVSRDRCSHCSPCRPRSRSASRSRSVRCESGSRCVTSLLLWALLGSWAGRQGLAAGRRRMARVGGRVRMGRAVPVGGRAHRRRRAAASRVAEVDQTVTRSAS